MTTNDIDIDAIRQREQAADPAPWTAHPDGLVWSQLIGDPVSGSVLVENAEFIAASRTAVPALLAKVDELTAALTQSRAQAATYANEIGNLTAENARLRQQRDEAKAEVDTLGMFKTRYFEVQEVLDKALGPDEEDGSGEGIVQDVHLLAEQRDVARAEADALRPHADGAVVLDAAGTEWALDEDRWLVNHPGGERLTWVELDCAYGPLKPAEATR